MKTFLLTGVVSLALILTLVPHQSVAYQATETNAVKLTDDTYLFTITNRMSYQTYGLSVPVLTERQPSAAAINLERIGYQIKQADGSVFTAGEAAAIMLSDTDYTNGRYTTDTSEAGLFTLLVLLRVSDPTDQAGSGVYLETSSYPFVLSKSDETIETALDSGQRASHVTPVVTW